MKHSKIPHPLLAIILALGYSMFIGHANAAEAYVPFDGEKSTWHDGFARYDYVMDETTFAVTPFARPQNERFAVGNPSKGQRRCIVVVPKEPAPGNPWSWQACYWDHQPQGEVELLRRGFHVCFITPDPGQQWDAWYAWLTEKHGLSKKPAFVGMSKGGVNEYDWTVLNPDKVCAIYADNPAIRPETFAKLDQLASHDVPLLNICGTSDFLLQRHTLPIENRYHELGGRITVMIKEGMAHHPHSLQNPKIIADFIERGFKASMENKRPDFADESFVKSYYYSLESSFVPLKEEKTYATCRGPGFVDCYERYDLKAKSQWGLGALAIIVPQTPAPGKPWIFRASNIPRDALVDQSLLAKGFHIVIAPLTAQSGAVKEEWDAAYKFMIDHGFSHKPAMEGIGASAGEAYAWAIENPDKVSCIYAENPNLHSLMAKSQPIEHLDVLAKANIPVLHDCGGLDPWLDDQTRAVEKRYKEMGGNITVIVREQDGHFLNPHRACKAIIEFLTAHATASASSPR